jgi:hypothetical protein
MVRQIIVLLMLAYPLRRDAEAEPAEDPHEKRKIVAAVFLQV